MKWIGSIVGIAVSIVLLAGLTRLLGMEDLVREALAQGKLLDIGMGALCLVWLLFLLKAPWDLYFDAHAAASEQKRAFERGIALEKDAEKFVQTLQKRLLWGAIAAHLVSAGIIAAITFFTHAATGYWFAGFYLLSTFFRPIIAGYVYLSRKLKSLLQETAYPPEDVVEMRNRVEILEDRLTSAEEKLEKKDDEIITLRHQLDFIGREFEGSLSKLTDQKAVIDGLQAIARIIASSSQS